MTNTTTAPTLGDIQRKYERAGVKDVEGLRATTDEFLAANPKPSTKVLGLLAGSWAFVAENIERDAWKSYTREQWAELEHQYIEKSKYTEPDLRDDLLTAVEYGGQTIEQAREVYATYKECDYVFCLNVFQPKRGAKYCCRDCKERQRKAVKRFETTGTYLPPTAYKEKRDQVKERDYRKHEVALDDDILYNEVAPFQERREHGYKRERTREDFSGFTARRGV